MAGDLGSKLESIRAANYKSDATHRVKPIDRDSGRNAQEHFRDNLQKKEEEKTPSSSPENPLSDAPVPESQPIEDRVFIGQPTPSPESPASNSEPGESPSPESAEPLPKAKAPDSASTETPPTKDPDDGHVHVVA